MVEKHYTLHSFENHFITLVLFIRYSTSKHIPMSGEMKIGSPPSSYQSPKGWVENSYSVCSQIMEKFSEQAKLFGKLWGLYTHHIFWSRNLDNISSLMKKSVVLSFKKGFKKSKEKNWLDYKIQLDSYINK